MLLIDTSYYIFYRYYASLHWYSLRNKDVDAVQNDMTEDVAFMHAFYSHIDKDIAKWKQKHKGAPILLCKDCKREDIWRMKLHPEYKGTREQAPTFRGEIFPLAYRHLEKNGMRSISHPCLEADDIAFITQEYFRSKGYSETITIVTNDNDYLQINDTHVALMNMQGKDIRTRGTGNARDDKLKKILMGDKSDNICPIMKGVGPKTVEKLLLLSEDQLLEWIKNKGGDEAVSKYENNRVLIDFQKIPDAFKEDVHLMLEKFEII
jgi:5'-3' exonuclease